MFPGLQQQFEMKRCLHFPGCHQLRYTVEASFAGADGECAMMSDDVFLLLTEEPQPAFDMAEEVCWDGVAGSIQLPTLYNGDTWGDNSTRTYNWTATLKYGCRTCSNDNYSYFNGARSAN